jgi:hypothetical protein
MVREIDAEQILQNNYVITHVVEPGTFDEPWDRAQTIHEVTTAHDYAPRGPSVRQLDRHDVGFIIHGMLSGSGDSTVAIGVHLPAKDSNRDDMVNQLQAVLEGGFRGFVVVARHLPTIGEAQGVNPKDVLNKAIGPDNIRLTRWAVINQGTQRNGF